MSADCATKYFGRYELLGRRLNLSCVSLYEAFDPRTASHVILRAERGQSASRPAMLASSEHPALLKTLGRETDSGESVEVMESFDGTPLEDGESRRAFSRDSALNIIGQIAEGLDAIHATGAILGTLRPLMILVNAEEHVKILDASLATPQSGLPASGFSPEDILDTLPYVSPEVLRGGMVGRGSDQFSLALISCRLLTGNAFVEFRSPIEAMIEVAFGDLDGQVLNAVPRALAGPLRKALSTAPGSRFASCTEFAEALRHAARQRTSAATRLVEDGAVQVPLSPVGPMPVPADLASAAALTSEETTSPSKDRRWLIAVVASILIAAAGFGYIWSSRRPSINAAPAMQTAPSNSHDAELLRALRGSGDAAPAAKTDESGTTSDKAVKTSSLESTADATAAKKVDKQSATAETKELAPATTPPTAPKKKKSVDLDLKPIEPTVKDSH
jgi:serine/threonine protein kinase